MIEQERSKRPVFLLVLCILSFIWLGIAVFGGLGGLMTGPLSAEEMGQSISGFDQTIEDLKRDGMQSWVPTFEKFRAMTIQANKKFYAIQLTNLLIYAIGIFGVIKMFQGQKIGFHLYIIYSLLSVSQWYFFISPSDIPTIAVVLNLIFSGAFVSMYAANLKWMR